MAHKVTFNIEQDQDGNLWVCGVDRPALHPIVHTFTLNTPQEKNASDLMAQPADAQNKVDQAFQSGLSCGATSLALAIDDVFNKAEEEMQKEDVCWWQDITCNAYDVIKQLVQSVIESKKAP